ncbi:MAG: DUF1028 domain-containing protein, partial [Chloroflexota bacterium]
AAQAFINTSYGPRGLDLLDNGKSAQETLNILTTNDDGRDVRQAGVVDSNGQSAAFTGKNCPGWAGSITRPGYSIQGNTLTGESVLHEMEMAFLRSDGALENRLFSAILAGDKAGGDRRGRQSAAILVVKNNGGYGGYNDRMVDYRIDNDPDPIAKLDEILNLHSLYFGKSQPDEKILIEGQTLFELQNILQQTGYLKSTSAKNGPETIKALSAFIGDENFEERCNPEQGWIDRPIYEYLLGKFKNDASS